MLQKVKKEKEENHIINVKISNNSFKYKKMKLDELKKMIAEEYTKFQNEQMAPGVAVSDNDVDATGDDENAEETLRDIYDMLKDYFEGADDADDTADADDTDDADDADDEAPSDAALQERFQKLANIIKG